MNSVCLALEVLRPDAKWVVRGLPPNEEIEWNDTEQTQPTENEINTKLSELQNAEPFSLLRIERDRRLTACDWVVAKHTEHGKMVPEDWKIYRQALRDLPSISYRPEMDGNVLKMDSVAWPTPPE